MIELRPLVKTEAHVFGANPGQKVVKKAQNDGVSVQEFTESIGFDW
jgi:hypothetical protein